MKMKEYYREKFKQWFGECSPEPEQGDYEEDATDPENKPSGPLKKESEV